MTTVLALLVITLTDGSTLPPEIMRHGRCRMDAMVINQYASLGYELREQRTNRPIAAIECRPFRLEATGS